MRIKYQFKTAVTGLFTHKSRSLLTILGIVIGIASIILIASTGESAEKLITNELGGLGAETIVVRPGKQPKGPSDFADTLLSDSLKDRELEALRKKSNVPNAVDISPEVLISGSALYQGQTFKPVILGFSAEFMEKAMQLRISDGDIFTEQDIRGKARVAIIGSRVKQELFGEENPIGKNIQIKDTKLRVIGVYQQRGQVVFFNADELVVIPYTTAQTYLSGVKHYMQIVVRAENAALVDRVVYDIKQTLRDLHNITDPDKDDFHVDTQKGIVDQVQTIIGVFTIFLSLVVAISLIVGGIGIMNIMLVSVSERTREIGLRKALGATDKNILSQFLLEAVLLTGVGGIIGVAIGSLLSVFATIAIGSYMSTSVAFAFPIIRSLIGITSSMLVGLVFGIYPARQASKKSPIEALRYE